MISESGDTPSRAIAGRAEEGMTMVKALSYFKRKKGTSVEEFQEYWRTRHPEVATRLAGLRRYVQSHTLPQAYVRSEPAYDGIAEVWFDDTDAMRRLAGSAAHEAVRADEARFIDQATMGLLITEEHPIVEGAVHPDAVKMAMFLRRRPDLDVPAFQHYWRVIHGPVAAAVPQVRRYVQSHVRRSAYGRGRDPAFDGVALLWFDDTAALRASGATAEAAAAAADLPNFLASGAAPVILTREHVVL
jgi:uncharacterized protein (TIGR02118 family)